MKICTKCNENLEDGVKFCSKCGTETINIENKKSIKNTLKKILYVFIAIVFFIIFKAIASTGTQEVISTINDSSTDKIGLSDEVLAETASEMNKNLPAMVDEETRLDAVYGYQNSLNYKYTVINYTRADFSGISFNDIQGETMKNSVCTMPEMEIFRENKSVINYSYFDNEGVFIEKISIDTGSDC